MNPTDIPRATSESMKVRLVLEYEPETHHFWFRMEQPREIHTDVIRVMLALAQEDVMARVFQQRFGLQPMKQSGRIAAPPPGFKIPRNN